jgi:hypothetical protein
MIEPTEEFFPDTYDRTPEGAQRLFDRLLDYMQIDQARVRLVVPADWTDQDPLGRYNQGDPATIDLNPLQLSDPESVVGTLAHELAHEILIGGGLVEDNNEDLERMTDLLPIFLGLGIFGANSALREQSFREGRTSWWSIQKRGYLPMRMHAYGLALFAWARQEALPGWSAHLRLDIREAMLSGLKFLEKTSDTTLDLAWASPTEDAPKVTDWVQRLAHRSPSHRLLSLHHLAEHGPAAASACQDIARLLSDSDPDIPGAAAYALAQIGPAATICLPDLQVLLTSRVASQRVQAAYALGAIARNDSHVISDLLWSLDDNDCEVAGAAAYALGKCGAGDERVASRLLAKYETALIKCDYRQIELVATALLEAVVDAPALVRQHFQPLGYDLCQFAEDCIAEAEKKLKPIV